MSHVASISDVQININYMTYITLIWCDHKFYSTTIAIKYVYTVLINVTMIILNVLASKLVMNITIIQVCMYLSVHNTYLCSVKYMGVCRCISTLATNK
jgi:hypothetical protein